MSQPRPEWEVIYTFSSYDCEKDTLSLNKQVISLEETAETKWAFDVEMRIEVDWRLQNQLYLDSSGFREITKRKCCLYICEHFPKLQTWL